MEKFISMAHAVDKPGALLLGMLARLSRALLRLAGHARYRSQPSSP